METKVVDNTKWEYRVVKIMEYELTRSNVNEIINNKLNGTDGWEAFSTICTENTITFFLKRKYVILNNK